jgi:hypothetical protein
MNRATHGRIEGHEILGSVRFAPALYGAVQAQIDKTALLNLLD